MREQGTAHHGAGDHLRGLHDRRRQHIEQILREHRIRTATFGALEMVRELQDKHGDHEAVLSRHAEASVWVLVRKVATETRPQKMYLYHGRDAMDLKMAGLKVGPLYYARGVPDWDAILELISPSPQNWR